MPRGVNLKRLLRENDQQEFNNPRSFVPIILYLTILFYLCRLCLRGFYLDVDRHLSDEILARCHLRVLLFFLRQKRIN